MGWFAQGISLLQDYFLLPKLNSVQTAEPIPTTETAPPSRRPTPSISIAIFAWNVVLSLRRRLPAGADPWDGQTLEWATSSPPPRHNFDALPPIRSFAPLLDLREGKA
jgi:hypothetical protein